MAALVGVVIRSGMVLLLRRSDGRWEFPSARVEPGADEAAALARALREGLGVEARVGDRLPVEGAAARLVTGFSGALALPADARAWVEARRLLERDIVEEHRAIAAAVASHRRRDRYRGTHPRRFEEKYKELAADPAAVEKAKARGSTPAGTHLPIMLADVLEALAPLEGAAALDCTLGWGGHAEAVARAAGPRGRVVGLDRDGEELERTGRRLASLGLPVETRHADYARARAVLGELGLSGVDALLADLGVSSMQLDRPDRGMSFKNDGPLDMRMDRSRGATAAQWLEAADETRIAEALARFGDEPDAAKIAAALVALRARGRAPKTTAELAAAVARAKGLGEGRVTKKDAFSAHPATRTFQALRIAVNSERESLLALLRDLPALLRPGGRAVFLTFHSGEEALVERAWREQHAAGLWRTPPSPPRKPSPEEIRANPRARSARLWRLVRT